MMDIEKNIDDIVLNFGEQILKTINEMSDEVKLQALAKNGLMIQYIKNPTEDMKIVAIKNNYKAFQFLKNPSEIIQLYAVSKCGDMLSYIKEPSKDMMLLAVKTDEDAIDSIPDDKLDEDIMLAALPLNPWGVWQWSISNRNGLLIPESVKMKAIKLCPSLINDMKNPSDALISEAIMWGACPDDSRITLNEKHKNDLTWRANIMLSTAKSTKQNK